MYTNTEITNEEINISKLTGNKLLVKNSIINIIMQVLPLLTAFFTIPIMIKGYGVACFSILSIIWIVIGYSSFLDFGLGKALTQLISRKIGMDSKADLPELIWTSLIAITTLGLLAGVLMIGLTPLIVSILKIPAVNRAETLKSMYLLSASLPFLICIISLRGILESYQKFVTISLLNLPVLLCNYIAPIFLLKISNDISLTVLVIVIGRIIMFGGYFTACSKLIPDFYSKFTFKTEYLKPLLSFGGWLTISNIIGPLMSYMDRFIIATIVSSAIVAYYATPFDVLSKFWIISAALMSVTFPALAAEYFNNRARAKFLYFQCLKYNFLVLIVPLVLIFIFAKEGLTLWISADFAAHSYRIAQLLVLGILMNTLKNVPVSLIQASGKSDIIAKFIVAELPFYMFFLLFLVKNFGLIGAAEMWVVRNFLEAGIYHFISIKLLNKKERLA